MAKTRSNDRPRSNDEFGGGAPDAVEPDGRRKTSAPPADDFLGDLELEEPGFWIPPSPPEPPIPTSLRIGVVILAVLIVAIAGTVALNLVPMPSTSDVVQAVRSRVALARQPPAAAPAPVDNLPSTVLKAVTEVTVPPGVGDPPELRSPVQTPIAPARPAPRVVARTTAPPKPADVRPKAVAPSRPATSSPPTSVAASRSPASPPMPSPEPAAAAAPPATAPPSATTSPVATNTVAPTTAPVTTPAAATAGPAPTTTTTAAITPVAAAGAAGPRAAEVIAQRSASEKAVRDIIGRYVNAYGSLNVGAAKAVWPSVDTKALGRAFAGLESQAIYLTGCEVSVVIVSAKAHCAGTAQFTPKVGNKTEHLEHREWTFDFNKRGEQWTIAHVDVH